MEILYYIIAGLALLALLLFYCCVKLNKMHTDLMLQNDISEHRLDKLRSTNKMLNNRQNQLRKERDKWEEKAQMLESDLADMDRRYSKLLDSYNSITENNEP